MAAPSYVFTIRRVARMLNEDEERLHEIAMDMGLCSSRVAKRAVRQRQCAGLGSNNRVDTVTVESILNAGCRSSPTSII
jgi:hypothetical protein